MNTFKKKSLYAALAGVSALGVAGAAQAVNLNPDGLGQVLIYPYYTTRSDQLGNAFATLLTVVNSTASAKAVKVRFLEGKNSREVLDFNLFLSAYDVWTAAVLPNAVTGGGMVGTVDKSCTLPPFSSSPTAPYVQFVNFAYVGNQDDKGGSSLDRTREGYIEMIEMSTIYGGSTTEGEVTHDNGVPNCGSKLNNTQADNDSAAPSGGLFGGESLINVNSGLDYTADPTALDNYHNLSKNYWPSGSILPNLQQAQPPVSVVVSPFSDIIQSLWNNGSADPVSAVLMHSNVMNTYVLDTGTKSGTDWVVTMPTKTYYVNVGTGNAPKLFQRNFNRTEGSCDDVTLSIYDREEFVAIPGFSPPPPTQRNSLCWEANVVTFNNSNLLGSVNVANVPTSFVNGWLNLGFPTNLSGALPFVHMLTNGNSTITYLGSGTSSNVPVTYVGLPVIGFAVESYMNGTIQAGSPPVNVLSNYGGNFANKYQTTIWYPD